MVQNGSKIKPGLKIMASQWSWFIQNSYVNDEVSQINNYNHWVPPYIINKSFLIDQIHLFPAFAYFSA